MNDMKQFELHINKNKSCQVVNVSIPCRDITLMELMPSIHKIFDEIIRTELGSGHDIVCHQGCDECCHQLVPVSIPEVFFLDELLKSFPHKKQIRINHRFTKILHMIEHAGLLDDLRNPGNNHNIDTGYFNLKLKCPFLENNLCIIYKERPLVCREYNVTSDPRNCLDPYHNEIQKIRIKRNIAALMAVFAARVYGFPPVPIPMILFPSWANEHRNLTAKKWPGIWLFNKFSDGLMRLNDEKIQLDVNESPCNS